MGNKDLKVKYDMITEQRLLGALISVGKSDELIAIEIMTQVGLEYFYDLKNKLIFEVIEKLFNSKKFFDAESLSCLLSDDLYDYCMQIVINFRNTFYYERDIKCLRSFKLLRETLATFNESIIFCDKNLDPDECLNKLEQSISKIANIYTDKEELGSMYEKIIDNILSVEKDDPYVKTNLKTWPPFPASSMITIAAQSGRGKTYMGLFLMDQILMSQLNTSAIYFNLEMPERQLIVRHAGLLGFKAQTEKELISLAAPELLKRNAHIVSKPLMTIEEIENYARYISLKNKLSVIVIDYIGLVRTRTKFESKEAEQSEIASRLSRLALDLNCIVLTLLQVNRDHKNRMPGDKIPFPTDASYSMGCERSSSWWIGLDQPQVDSNDDQFKDLFMLANRKSRDKAGYFEIQMNFKDGIITERLEKKEINITNKFRSYAERKD